MSFQISIDYFGHAKENTGDRLARVLQWLAAPSQFFGLRKFLKSRTTDDSPGSERACLSAGIVKDLQQCCDHSPARSFAFFILDSNDTDKQKPVNIIKSLLGQFQSDRTSHSETLQSLYSACDEGGRQVSEQQLLAALKHTIEHLPMSFVVLTASDNRDNQEGLSQAMQGFHGHAKTPCSCRRRWRRSTSRGHWKILYCREIEPVPRAA